MKLTRDSLKYFPVRCDKCYWQGCSSKVFGGNPIADTGDYSDLACPNCHNERLNDEVPDYLNPFYLALYFIKFPYIKYQLWRYERHLDYLLKKMNSEIDSRMTLPGGKSVSHKYSKVSYADISRSIREIAKEIIKNHDNIYGGIKGNATIKSALIRCRYSSLYIFVEDYVDEFKIFNIEYENFYLVSYMGVALEYD